MRYFTTGVATVDQMGQLNMKGNIKPAIWNDTIVNEKGKPQRLAMDILADVVYWYRPTEVRDENSGLVVGWKKRFASDMLQRSYAELSDQFCEEKKTIIRAIVFLEELGVIKRIFRTLKYKSGRVANNVMFIDLNVDRLCELTFPEEDAIKRKKKKINETEFGNEDYVILDESNAYEIHGKQEQSDMKDEMQTTLYTDDDRVSTKMSGDSLQICPEGIYKNVERVSTEMSGEFLQKCPEPHDKYVETNTKNTTINTTENTTSISNHIKNSEDSCTGTDIDGIAEMVDELIDFDFLCKDAEDVPSEEFCRQVEFNSILTEVRNVLVYEVFAAPDDKQFNFGNREYPDYKSNAILKSVFLKYLNFARIKSYVSQYLQNSSMVKNVTMYHIKSLYRQCLTQSSQYMSGGRCFYARESY